MHQLTRPEGDGGWPAARRQEELATRVQAAGVTAPSTDAADPVPEMAPRTLDLPAVLALVAQGNRRIAAARTHVDTARARVADARGRLLPATTVGGRYTWYTDRQTTMVELDREVVEEFGITPEVTIRARDFGVVNGTIQLPLDLSGEIWAGLRAAQAGYRGERARLWATTLMQGARAVGSYLQLLEAERLRDVAEQTVTVDREQLRNTQSRYDSGRVTKNELLVVQVALRNAEQELLQRTQAIDRARWQLNDVVGLEVNAAVVVADVVAVPALPDIPTAIALAWESNPIVTSLLEEQQRLEATVTALERSRFPRFSAGGAGDYTSADVASPQQFGSGFVGFTLDLGTDTRREAQIAEARAAAERNRVDFEHQLRELETMIRRTQQAVVERIAATTAAKSAVGQAEENLRIRQQQFDVGRAESADVLDAEALLAGQRAILASARYQAHARRAELQQLMGLPLADLWAAEGIKGSRDPGIKDPEQALEPSISRSLDPLIPRSLSSAE